MIGSRFRLEAQVSHPCFLALRVSEPDTLESEAGGLCGSMEWSSRSSSWRRTYQCCQGPACSNWIWQDKICEGYVCRQCGLAWSRPPQGYSSHPSSRRLYPISRKACSSTEASDPPAGVRRAQKLQDRPSSQSHHGPAHYLLEFLGFQAASSVGTAGNQTSCPREGA